ncbi:uncharacterized protein LOC129240913 [Anastrepha obliqua]|uniref:uncharacterized protein LOC129240913 n=1 Tax=Anastrepha obliqua TaxID=95512 RepID=UPI002409D6BD|nr:uncharacterized protein LOC129240913 [Anastrepha obliqua]
MIADKDFILTVRLYPEIYNTYSKNGVLEGENNKELWAQLAQETHMKSGAAAESKWRQLVSKYLSFLVYGTSFAYEKEMQFMQMPLLAAGDTEDAQSESDIDEAELKNVLNSYVDCEPAIKRQRAEATEGRAASLKKYTRGKELHNDEYNVQKNKEHSPVTNATTKQSFELHDNTKGGESETSGKTNEMLNQTPKDKESEFINPEPANEDCGVLSATIVPPPSIAANISNDNTRMSTSFTNLTSLELIFLGYAKVLQRMPLRLQLQTKRKIADIMDEAELKMFEDK